MIDTHCHIDDPQYIACQEGLDTFIHCQQQAGVEKILVPGVDVTSIQPVLDVCRKYPGYLYPAIGLHPENVKEDYREQLAVLHAALSSEHIAIGEIGLDYHFDTTFREEQQFAFREQMRWAEQRKLPVMIHSRDATEDSLAILREFPQVTGVMHCFSGSNEIAKQIVALGYYLGIGGVLTFKNCKLKEHLASIPLERIVLETDAPYMAPVPHRGERNESRWMSFVRDMLAEIYGTTAEHIDEITTENAYILFKTIK